MFDKWRDVNWNGSSKKNAFRPQNDGLDTDPLITSTVGTTGTSNLVGVTHLILNQLTTSTSLLGVVVSLPPVANISTTHKVTLVVVGDLTPPCVLSFTLPLGTRDYPCGMPITMMAGLQSHALMLADNDAMIVSPLNPYLASGSSISNLNQMAQPQGGIEYLPLGMPTITTN